MGITLKKYPLGGLNAFLALALALALVARDANASDATVSYYGNPVIAESLEIDEVWAANRVHFDLHVRGDRQFVAYYDRHRMMTVASRQLGSDAWEKTTLSSKLHWDSHNYVAMGLDEKGYIHVSGNMHVDPLVYYRSEKPFDVTTMREVHRMTGELEDRVTYPKFSNDRQGRLLFSYRAGTCGDGNVLVKRFDARSMSWENHSDVALFEGVEADANRAAYHRTVRDSKGEQHYLWIWRWTPEVATSHQICYAKTPDQKSWVNAFGQPVSLPHRPDTQAVIVDDTPSRGGMHNSRFQLILDAEDQPIVGYVKYDEEGNTQLYLARPGKDEWLIRKVSDWDVRWEFFGGGDTMAEEAVFRLSGFSDEGKLVIPWQTTQGSGTFVVDPKTLQPSDRPARMKRSAPNDLEQRLSDHPDLRVNLTPGKSETLDDGGRYFLKWETMKGSHGKHAPEVIPEGPTSKLLLLKVEDRDQPGTATPVETDSSTSR